MTAEINTRQVLCKIDGDVKYTTVYLVGKVEFEASQNGHLTCKCEDREDITICFSRKQAQEIIKALTAALGNTVPGCLA